MRAQNHQEFEHVRIPPELTAKLDHFFSDLKLTILKRAVRQAATRANSDNVCVVKIDDLQHIAAIVFTETMAHSQEDFLRVEPQHVRRAS